MSDILVELSAARRKDAEDLARNESFAALKERVRELPPPADFCAAFSGPGLHVIAELKKASPSEGLIRADFEPVDLAGRLASAGAAALSVLCEPHRFLGSDAYLDAVRKTVAIPLLYKDFITTPYQILRARATGASACLLIAAVLPDDELAALLNFARKVGLAALVETHTEDEIRRAVQTGARLIGVNCRDLRTFRTDPAITAALLDKIPADRLRIAESGLRTADDLAALRQAGADGFLVGTTLMRAPDPAAKLRELISKGTSL